MGKKLSKLLGVFCVGLLFALCGMSASAAETQENVMYYDENGETKYAESATVVTSEMTEWTEGWYVVNDSVTIYQDVEITGNVNLILQGCLEPDELIDIDTASLEIVGSITGDGILTIYGQGKGNGLYGWQTSTLGELQCHSNINVNIVVNSGRVNANIDAQKVHVGGGYINEAYGFDDDVYFDTFTMSGGYVDSSLNQRTDNINSSNDSNEKTNVVAISNGTVSDYITVYGNVSITGGTIIGSISGYSVSVSNGEIEGSVSAVATVSITGGTVTESVNGNWVDISNAVVGNASGELQVNVYSGSVSGRVSSDNGVVNIIGGTVGDVFSLNQIYIGDADSGTSPVIEEGIVSNDLGMPGTVWMETGTVYGDIYVDHFNMEGGEVKKRVVISKNGMIFGGTCNNITMESNTFLHVKGGTIGRINIGPQSRLSIDDGNISSLYGDGSTSVVYDNTAGQALPADFKPYDMLYLSYDLTNKTVTGLLGGNVRLAQDFGVYAPSEWGDQAKMEVVILPGATATVNCFRFTGDLLVQGTLQASPDISTNPMVIGTTPYYAINADSETVASVSAGDSIVRDGVTFVPEGKVVTLKSKGTGAMHWAAQPAYLNVTNNKFYMPDEVVSVKASALPLEATPTIQVDGEKLTGFTAGEYYSISDAIFRPTGTTLPIRPEWYGVTVSIVKLGDGFATGASFAQALAIPSQSGGTVTPPNPGGGTGSKPDPDGPEEIVIPDGDWEEAEEELSQADSGDTVIVETDEDDTLPGEVLESAAGKNVTLIIQVGTIISWEIDCREIPKAASLQDISLQVSMNTQGIPESVLQGLPGSHPFQQMTLGHDGPFGFPVKLHTNVGRENSGKWANLYYYNEESGKMEFETAARVTASGDAAFTMTHASQYSIVLDEKSHTLSFQDVKEGSWFQDAVEYVYRAGLMAGTGDTTFEPNAQLTRAMTAQILYNLEGQPEVTGEATFSDMNTAPDWSMDAIAWAQDTGVVAGMGDNTFAPNLKVTREQFAQMLYNYAKYKKCDLTKAGDLTKFPDEVSISTWAENALSWANGNGLINGHENGTLDPQGNTVRGQAASILMNFDLNVVKSVA